MELDWFWAISFREIVLWRKSIDFADTISRKIIAFQRKIISFLKTLDKKVSVLCIRFSLEQHFFWCFGQSEAL